MKLSSFVDESCDTTYNYWNNAEEEHQKNFFSSKTPSQIIQFPKYLSIYNDVINILESRGTSFSAKSFLSLACGSCWLEALLAEKYTPKSVTAVDFSLHRIHHLAPLSFRQASPNYHSIDLIHGDILKLDFPPNTFDVVILSQAFHHTNQPILLLKSIAEVLSDTGIVLIVGEHYYSRLSKIKQTLRHFYKWSFSQEYRNNHSLYPSYSTLYPPCFEKGDIHYAKSDYHFIFSSLGWKYRHFINRKSRIQSFMLSKN